MMDFIDYTYSWFMSLGDQYGVNPIIFGAIYIGAIPFFTLSVAWLIRNYRRGFSIVLPVFCTIFFFISAYLYLMIVGENVPWWVYGVVAFMILYGAWSTYRKIKMKLLAEAEREHEQI